MATGFRRSRDDDSQPIERSLRRVSSLSAIAVGTLGVLVVIGIVLPFGEGSSRIIHAALLIIPVIVAGLLGGRLSAVVVSAEAAMAFSLFLEPFGSPQVRVATELVALVVFALAAAMTGVLVATVVDAERARVLAEHGRLEALEQTEQQRKALLRSVSHDLRTPLATIRGATEELYEGVAYDVAGRRELLRMVLTETERLDRIVANMLSLSRIEAGAFLPARQPLLLGDLIPAILGRLRPVLEPRTIVLDLPADLPPLEADRSQIDQVLTNVLENAARHTPPATTITIAVTATETGIQIVVSDDGDGFPAGSADKLFEPFAMATGAGSSGIGLAISRSIVDAHGGTMTAGNRPEGGARVTIAVPLRG